MALHLAEPEPANPKLIVEGVSKRYLSKRATVEALENVSLTVLEGEFVCLLGPSGCGKSTLLDIKAGLTKPDRGQVLSDGHLVTGPSQQRLVMFQEAALFPCERPSTDNAPGWPCQPRPWRTEFERIRTDGRNDRLSSRLKPLWMPSSASGIRPLL